MPSVFNGSSVLFKAIYSNAWESIDQNFYTRLAQTIDPIDSTITFYAEILSSGILKSLDKEGNDTTENDALIALLKNPNENQNFQQFIKEWLYYHYAHGWNYIIPQSTAIGFEKRLDGKTKTQLFNCDPDHIDWENNTINSLFNFFKKSESKVSFSYKPLGLANINYTSVIPFFDVRQNSEKPYIGVSRLLSLRQQIQNYSLSLQGKENLIKGSGSRLISLDAKTEDMGMDAVVGTGQFDKEGNPITTTQKENLENQMRSTGIGSANKGIIFANIPLKITHLSAGLENIGFDQLMIADAKTILNKFNLPKEFQNLEKEAPKFQNRQMAMIEVVQNTIEPLADSFCKTVSTFFNWENTIKLDFSHLPVFSDNELIRAETQQAIITMYTGLFQSGIIDQAQFTQILIDNGIIN